MITLDHAIVKVLNNFNYCRPSIRFRENNVEWVEAKEIALIATKFAVASVSLNVLLVIAS